MSEQVLQVGQEALNAIVAELQEVEAGLWSTNALRGRQINCIVQRLVSLAPAPERQGMDEAVIAKILRDHQFEPGTYPDPDYCSCGTRYGLYTKGQGLYPCHFNLHLPQRILEAALSAAQPASTGAYIFPWLCFRCGRKCSSDMELVTHIYRAEHQLSTEEVIQLERATQRIRNGLTSLILGGKFSWLAQPIAAPSPQAEAARKCVYCDGKRGWGKEPYFREDAGRTWWHKNDAGDITMPCYRLWMTGAAEATRRATLEEPK